QLFVLVPFAFAVPDTNPVARIEKKNLTGGRAFRQKVIQYRRRNVCMPVVDAVRDLFEMNINHGNETPRMKGSVIYVCMFSISLKPFLKILCIIEIVVF